MAKTLSPADEAKKQLLMAVFPLSEMHRSSYQRVYYVDAGGTGKTLKASLYVVRVMFVVGAPPEPACVDITYQVAKLMSCKYDSDDIVLYVPWDDGGSIRVFIRRLSQTLFGDVSPKDLANVNEKTRILLEKKQSLLFVERL